MLVSVLFLMYHLIGPIFRNNRLLAIKESFRVWSYVQYDGLLNLNEEKFKQNSSNLFFIICLWSLFEFCLWIFFLGKNSLLLDQGKIFATLFILVLLGAHTMKSIKRFLGWFFIIMSLFLIVALLIITPSVVDSYGKLNVLIDFPYVEVLSLIYSPVLIFGFFLFAVYFGYNWFLKGWKLLLKRIVDYEQFNPLTPFVMMSFLIGLIGFILKTVY